MKRLIVYLLIIVLAIPMLQAQKKRTDYKKYNKRSQPLSSNDKLFDGTINLVASAFGPGFLYGDIGGSSGPKSLLGLSDWNVADTRVYWGLGSNILFPSNVGVKVDLHYGTFRGSDVSARNGGHRAWSYTSTIFEGTLQGMVVLFGGPYDPRGKSHMLYLFGGVGQMMSIAKVEGDLTNRDNADLISTGDIAPVIPFGIGYQFRASSNLSIGAEFTYHYVLSDFIDGIHSKYSKSEDLLAAANFTISYQLYGVECKTCEWSHQSMQGPIIKRR